MASPRTNALLFGHDRRVALWFLVVAGVAAVAASTSLSRTVVDLIGITPALLIGLTVVAGYAYWNDGFAACWLSIFAVLFGGIHYEYTHPRLDIVHAEPLEQAFLVALVVAGFTAPLVFVVGTGVRALTERVGLPERFRSVRTVSLVTVVRGVQPTPTTPLLLGGVLGGVALGVGLLVVGPLLEDTPPDWILHPVLVAVVLVGTAVLNWRYAGVLPTIAPTFLGLFGLFVGALVVSEGSFEALRAGLWNAVVVTLVVGVPGSFVGELPRLRQGPDAQPAPSRT